MGIRGAAEDAAGFGLVLLIFGFMALFDCDWVSGCWKSPVGSWVVSQGRRVAFAVNLVEDLMMIVVGVSVVVVLLGDARDRLF